MSYYSYGYDYGDFGGMFGSSEFMAVLGILLGFIAVFAIITWVMSLAMYILRSLGLYRLSENRGMSGSALAWIPFIGCYRIGAIADDIVARNGGTSHYRHILLIGGIVNLVGGIGGWFLTTSDDMFSQFLGNFFGYSSRRYTDFFDYGDFFAVWGANLLLSLVSITLFVFTVIALNKIYKCYRPLSSTSWTVLSVIFPFMQSIFPFVLRNAVPVSEWGAQGYYPMQNTMPNQNWQAPPPPQYNPYNQQPPVNGVYPPQNQGWQQPPPPARDSWQPPVAPNPPEPWELDIPGTQPPPQAPWDQDGNRGS